MMSLTQHLEEFLHSYKAHGYKILYLYTDLRFLGKFRKISETKAEFLDSIINLLLSMNFTVVIPTFSYTVKGIFEVETTPTRLGALNSRILENPSVVRSEHPIFSFGACGPSSQIIKNIGKAAFGLDSVHERLLHSNAAFLYIGRPIRLGNTIIHYIEQQLNVDYRFNKTFPTKVFQNKTFIGENYSAFVRKTDNPDNNYEFSFTKSTSFLQESGIIHEKQIDKDFSNLSLMSYNDTYHALLSLIQRDSNAFLSKSVYNKEKNS
jgi:aminoglycoside 3-N-acetyltransferase